MAESKEFQAPEPGTKWKLFYNDGNPNNKTYEVRLVDDDAYIVVRWWQKSREFYWYDAIVVEAFQEFIKKGWLTKIEPTDEDKKR